jgi:hemolysin III
MAVVWTEENASQESLNAWTHGIGFLLSVPASIWLCWLAAHESSEKLMACMVYGLSLCGMYLFSMLSHAIREPVRRNQVRSIDQGVIYTLIAGTFTPFIATYLDGIPCILLMTAVWAAAIAGFYSKIFAKHRIDNMTSVSYVLLGWIPAMVLFSFVPYACFGMMIVGGVLYTVGTQFLQNDHIAWYFHAIWHTLVILASLAHFVAIVVFCI